MNQLKQSRKILGLLISSALASTAQAGGFALQEQNASGAGAAYAGKSALGEDASAAWFNPASMSRLKKQEIVIGLHAINVNGEFRDNGRSRDATNAAANDGGNPGELAFIPNFHYVRPINEKMNFGFSVGVPFGLSTEYDNRWVGRFQGVSSEIKTIDLNPSVSYKVDENLSVGFGVSAQYLKATLTQAALYPTAEGTGVVTGDSTSYGFNAGALLQVGPKTRLGLAYRSEIKHDLEGSVQFQGNEGQSDAVRLATSNGNLVSTITLPASLSLSSVTELDEKWNLLTDFTWTEWSSLQELRFSRVPSNPNVLELPVQPLNWRNTMRYAVGMSYQYSQKTKVRFGVAYDESPVQASNRIVRLPDENRIVLALGSQYQLSDSCRVDVGFQYIKSRDASINSDGGDSRANGLVSGSFKGDGQILSTQFSYRF
jgi:long-chain fatty acid transport protein